MTENDVHDLPAPHRQTTLRQLFENDPERGTRYNAEAVGIFLDYSKNRITDETLRLLVQLAEERGLTHLGWATIVSARTAIEARVMVTERVRSLTVAGQRAHVVGLPYHWGPNGFVTGDAANDLLGIAMDPNVHIQESKVATCDIRPGRRPRGPALLRLVEAYQRRAGITIETGSER